MDEKHSLRLNGLALSSSPVLRTQSPQLGDEAPPTLRVSRTSTPPPPPPPLPADTSTTSNSHLHLNINPPRQVSPMAKNGRTNVSPRPNGGGTPNGSAPGTPTAGPVASGGKPPRVGSPFLPPAVVDGSSGPPAFSIGISGPNNINKNNTSISITENDSDRNLNRFVSSVAVLSSQQLQPLQISSATILANSEDSRTSGGKTSVTSAAAAAATAAATRSGLLGSTSSGGGGGGNQDNDNRTRESSRNSMMTLSSVGSTSPLMTGMGGGAPGDRSSIYRRASDVLIEAKTIVNHFPGDYNPRSIYEVRYWARDEDLPPQFHSMTCVIPFFNEDAYELENTLRSLHGELRSLAFAGFRFHVMLVCDGWWKASDSMKTYLQNMFPMNPTWAEIIEPIPEGKEDAQCVETFIVQRVSKEDERVVLTEIGKDEQDRPLYMRVSLMVKRENRRKHNAHVWFLSSFAPAYKSKYVFLTDCGTQFKRGCLAYLTDYLNLNPTTSAVSGRQRVMTPEMQGDVEESVASFAKIYRWAQCFDYESSTACFNGAFSIFGMLPVVPGPCGLYRFDFIYDDKARRERYKLKQKHDIELDIKLEQECRIKVEDSAQQCGRFQQLLQENVVLWSDLDAHLFDRRQAVQQEMDELEAKSDNGLGGGSGAGTPRHVALGGGGSGAGTPRRGLAVVNTLGVGGGSGSAASTPRTPRASGGGNGPNDSQWGHGQQDSMETLTADKLAKKLRQESSKRKELDKRMAQVNEMATLVKQWKESTVELVDIGEERVKLWKQLQEAVQARKAFTEACLQASALVQAYKDQQGGGLPDSHPSNPSTDQITANVAKSLLGASGGTKAKTRREAEESVLTNGLTSSQTFIPINNNNNNTNNNNNNNNNNTTNNNNANNTNNSVVIDDLEDGNQSTDPSKNEFGYIYTEGGDLVNDDGKDSDQGGAVELAQEDGANKDNNTSVDDRALETLDNDLDPISLKDRERDLEMLMGDWKLRHEMEIRVTRLQEKSLQLEKRLEQQEEKQNTLRHQALLKDMDENERRRLQAEWAVSERRRKLREEAALKDKDAKMREDEKKRREEEAKNIVDAIDFYLTTCHKDPDETGMVMGSLLLAEDRVLSYAAVLKTKTRARSEYDPRAVFYFQAETDAEKLLAQRRRWINGTVAGYLWLIQNQYLIWESKLWSIEKFMLFTLILCQLMMYMIVALAPSLFAIGLHFALAYTFDSAGKYDDWMLLGYLALYVSFVLVHTQNEDRKLVTWLFKIVAAVNMMITPWLISLVVVRLYESGLYSLLSTNNFDLVDSLLLWLILANMFGPFILGMMHGPWDAMKWMGWSFIQFYLFLPTMVGYFGAYAFSRTWDLSWGNRPSEQLRSLVATTTKKEHDYLRNRLKQHARFWCWLIVLANLFVVVLVAQLELLQFTLLVLACIVFCWPLLQMLCSFIFLALRLLKRLRHTCCRIMCCRKRFKDYLRTKQHISAQTLRLMLRKERIYKQQDNFYLGQPMCVAVCLTACDKEKMAKCCMEYGTYICCESCLPKKEDKETNPRKNTYNATNTATNTNNTAYDKTFSLSGNNANHRGGSGGAGRVGGSGASTTNPNSATNSASPSPALPNPSVLPLPPPIVSPQQQQQASLSPPQPQSLSPQQQQISSMSPPQSQLLSSQQPIPPRSSSPNNHPLSHSILVHPSQLELADSEPIDPQHQPPPPPPPQDASEDLTRSPNQSSELIPHPPPPPPTQLPPTPTGSSQRPPRRPNHTHTGSTGSTGSGKSSPAHGAQSQHLLRRHPPSLTLSASHHTAAAAAIPAAQRVR